jgi:four helix bundle protein
MMSKNINLTRNNYCESKDFISLRAWQQCRDVKLFFYQEILTNLPEEEKYNLGIQIRKASTSITANIAEGYGRYHFQEAKQFFRIARSSLYELKDHLVSCYDLGFILENNFTRGILLIESAKRMINGYINYLEKKT